MDMKNLCIISNKKSYSFIEIGLERRMGRAFKKHDPATYRVVIAYKKMNQYYSRKPL